MTFKDYVRAEEQLRWSEEIKSGMSEGHRRYMEAALEQYPAGLRGKLELSFLSMYVFGSIHGLSVAHEDTAELTIPMFRDLARENDSLALSVLGAPRRK
jgi:hypothetical protein